jgi:hypothetical protein
MSDPPTPTDVPTEVRQALADCDPKTLEAVADYARGLADQRRDGSRPVSSERTVDPDECDQETTEKPAKSEGPADESPDEWDQAEWEAAVREADAPGRATLTVKTINDNRYYYLQWREGDHVRSAYVGPASPTS